VLTAFLAPATLPAQAAVLTTDRACYRDGEPVRLAGGPFTPSGAVDVALDGTPLPGRFAADTTGNLAVQLVAPAPGRAAERRFVVAASDRLRPASAGIAVRLVSRFGVSVQPGQGGPGIRRRITARGFTGGGTLYAHVARGRARRTVRVGRLVGACGTMTARKRLLRRGSRRGTYRVQFDSRRGYSRRTVPRVVYKVPVGRVFRAATVARWAARPSGRAAKPPAGVRIG